MKSARKMFFVALFFSFVCAPFLFAETGANVPSETDAKPLVGKRIFSLDLSYMGEMLKNNGFGLGATLEIQILDFFSLRPGLAHSTMWRDDLDLIVTTVGVRLDTLFYPFNRGLDKLYLGGIMRTDFIMVTDNNRDEKIDNITIISIAPIVGWKQQFGDIVMADFFVDFRFVQNTDSVPRIVIDELDHKWEYGVKLKFNIGKIIRKIRKR